MDIFKTAVVIIVLIAGALILPFFLTALAVCIICWVIYMLVKATRLYNEQEKANAKAKAE